MATESLFANIAQAPEDPFYSLVVAYEADASPNKIDLGVGAYRDEQGKPWRLPSVAKAERLLYHDESRHHEYLSIAGLQSFVTAAQAVILGKDSTAIQDHRVCSFQTLSGTGALHLGGALLAGFASASPLPSVHISDPSWPIHRQVFTNVGLAVETYNYFDTTSRSLDLDGLLAALAAAPPRSIIVLHACAHNPTGVDPSHEQWKLIAQTMKEYNHCPFFDCAYQGFATGDLDEDAFAIRHFVEEGFEMLVAQSFAKNMGLYAQRIGALHYVAAPGSRATEITRRVHSQLSVLQRSDISSPPAYGAHLAAIVLTNPEIFAQWKQDILTMSGRVTKMRRRLRAALERLETPGAWNHITEQIGMFSFTGLTEPQVQRLLINWHCHMSKTGRISVAGLNDDNVEYFARAVDNVVRAGL